MSQIVVKETERYTALKEAERRIATLAQRAVNEAIAMGHEFMRIRDEKLYEAAGYDRFSEYVEIELTWSYREVSRLMNVSLTARNLEAAGLRLPSNESQLLALGRLPPEKQAATYEEILVKCEKKDLPVTVALIDDTVERELKVNPTPAGAVKTGIEVPDLTADLADAISGSAYSETRARMSLDEEGEAALVRIKDLCGEAVGEAIEFMSVPLSQKELVRWASLEEALVKAMAHYIVHERWNLTQALRYESRSINGDGNTTVKEMLHWARSRGGYYALQIDRAIVTVQIQS